MNRFACSARWVLRAVFGIVTLLVVTASHAVSVYTILEIPRLPGDGGILAYDINDAGQVAGVSVAGDTTSDAAIRFENGVTTNLGHLGGGFSVANAINNSGYTTGWAGVTGGETHAFLHNGTSMSDLGTLGFGESIGGGINDFGHVVGSLGISGDAFFYDGVSMIDLATLGVDVRNAQDINNVGQIVGQTGDTLSAFILTSGVLYDLGTLGGSTSHAGAINESGHAVGEASLANGHRHAFLYNGSMMIDLGTLGGNFSIARDINNSGQIVGRSLLAGSGVSGFLYDNGTMHDLNDLLLAGSGWTIHDAYGINSSGQIVGHGDFNGIETGFVLSPIVPVPPAAWLFGSALGLLGWMRRKAT